MPALRDIALTVEERNEHQFFWVILEALDSDAAEAIHYARIFDAATPQPSYASALAMGAAALRKLAGPEHETRF
ncbi:hypothetical protein QTH87_11730 [Variovorax sp. J22P168]|uniref:hypothetical protein n=1 Tax=Variovorax jilinensis TaxID=3053513 RepID=UPI0025752386|nr:hypothetical protein [Variovorax sp. J22P168]MDM0013104.1 hypothetical protein [Variovorax sp. J22P168]